MRRAAAAVLLGAALLAAACGGKSAPEVRVFAASSLTDVMRTLAADYGKQTGTKVVLNCASSSTLARQIVEGAPCDLFLSADEEWAEYVAADESRMWEPPQDFLTNRMVVVLAEAVPSPAPWHILDQSTPEYAPGTGIRDALRTWGFPAETDIRKIAVGDPQHVPAGRYARNGLRALGLWDECVGRLVPCDSVRAALALVQRGEAEAGIVYATDAKGAGLRVVTEVSDAVLIGPDLPIDYLPGAEARYMAVIPLKDSETGPALLDWLRTPPARVEFRKAGFGIPGEER